MITYNKDSVDRLVFENKEISTFIEKNTDSNIDWDTVDSFGDEWTKFSSFSEEEISKIGDEYFDIVNDRMLNKSMTALDVGCGTGRWSKYVASKAGFVEAIDPSHAVFSAMHLLKDVSNVRITQAEVEALPFPNNSFDFVFSLGVLHHIPDTSQAMKDSVSKLKKGGYFLVYLYYALDNRGPLFKMVFHLSNLLRRVINKLPQGLKSFVCDVLAFVVYIPLVSFAKVLKNIFPKRNWYKKIPLSVYHNKSLQVIRNDSLDRFGTPLEQRFTRLEIEEMMKSSGLTDITFSEKEPFWHAIGRKA